MTIVCGYAAYLGFNGKTVGRGPMGPTTQAWLCAVIGVFGFLCFCGSVRYIFTGRSGWLPIWNRELPEADSCIRDKPVCPHCGYSRAGMSNTAICPECGETCYGVAPSGRICYEAPSPVPDHAPSQQSHEADGTHSP